MVPQLKIPAAPLFCAILIAICAALYSPGVHNPLIWDDGKLITENAFIHDASNIKNLATKKYFDQTIELSYRPAGTLLLFASYAAGKGAPEPFRVTSIILHSASSILVFLLVLLALRAAYPEMEGLETLSFAVAALFAAHPVNTEAVNGATFLEDPMCLIFAASSFIAWAKYRKAGGAALLVLSLALFSIGLLSKETAIALPAAIFAWAFLFSETAGKRGKAASALCAAAPFGAVAAAYIVLRFVIMKNPAEQAVYHGGSAYGTLLLSCRAWLEYLRLAAFPARQCADYFLPGSPSLSQPLFAAGAAGAVVFFIAFAALVKRNAAAAFGLAWYAAFLLPVSNIIPIGVTMAERYLYAPLPGLLLAAASLAVGNKYYKAAVNKALPAGAFLFAALACAALANNRNAAWADEITFWRNANDCSVESPMPLVNLGVAYFNAGKLAGAAAALEKAVEVASKYDPAKDRYGNLHRARGNLGMTLAAMGRGAEAEKNLREALRLNPGYAAAHFNLAVVYLKFKKGDSATLAALELAAGLSTEPKNIRARAMLAGLYERAGRQGDAAAQYRALAETDTANAAKYLARAAILEKGNLRGR